MNNIDIAHEFFYNYDNGRYYPNYKNLGYDGNRFFSYSTLIAMLETSKNGETICLLSENNFSISTAKHLNYLRGACPFKKIYVFMEYGERNGNPEIFAKRALKKMEYYAGANLRQRANRDGFLTAFNSFNGLADNFKLSVKMPKKYTELAAIINDSAAVKNYQLRAEQRAKRAEQRRRAALKKLLNGRNLLELAKIGYSYDNDSGFTGEQRAFIRQTINPDYNLSFIWTDDNGDFQTSQHIHIDRAEGLAALKLWVAGRLKHGLTVGRYTVLEVMADYVKIGCHKIPVENLKELATAAGLI